MVGSRFERFLSLHQKASPLVMPNAWDIGSAKIFESLGFEALATTSSGFAATLGRLDGGVGREAVLDHARAISLAVTVPVSGDLEDCFAGDPNGVAETVRLACETGLAGCSIEDYDRERDLISPLDLAIDRVRAAAEAAHGGSTKLVLTGRCENYVHGRMDLADTINRLQAYQDAGADVLFAPGVNSEDDLRVLIASVDFLARTFALTVERLLSWAHCLAAQLRSCLAAFFGSGGPACTNLGSGARSTCKGAAAERRRQLEREPTNSPSPSIGGRTSRKARRAEITAASAWRRGRRG